MPKQVLIIHGGTSFKTYLDYLSYLKTAELNLESLRPKDDWKRILPKVLGKKYDVLVPRMPNRTYARYREWKIWFERISKMVQDEIILVGHSLGGLFLVKYLSENNFPSKIKALILIAAPFKDDKNIKTKISLKDFALSKPLFKVRNQCQNIYIFHSKDDPIVPFSHAEKYKKALPGAKLIALKNRGHFTQKTFPELSKLILSL